MRCSWLNENNEQYVKYHDEEWGVAVFDDNKLFEMLVLESFQAGLSWQIILKKRDAFRHALDNFDYKKISKYTEEKIIKLMNDPAIIRSRSKITVTIKNAQIFMKIQQEYGSFSRYLWHFTNGKIMHYGIFPCPTHNELSDTISADLKKRGMKYVGSVIIYSYLQAVGVIDDHEPQCCCYKSNRHDIAPVSKP